MLKPLNKNVILQKEKVENKTASGIILTGEKEDMPNVASVVAVASDCTSDLQPGQKVVYKEYSGTNLTLDQEDYILIEDKNILAIVE